MRQEETLSDIPNRPIGHPPGAHPGPGYPPSMPPPQPRREGGISCGALAGILAAIVFVLAGLAAAAVLFGPQLVGWKEMPNVIGLPQAHAEHYLEESKIPFKLADAVASSPEYDGYVIAQVPPSGRYVSPSTEVILSVGRYSEAQEALSPPPEPVEGSESPPETPSAPTAEIPTEAPLDTAQQPTAETDTPEESTPEGVAAAPTPTLSNLTGGGRGQLAFASDRSGTVQIWLVTLDAGEPEQLTDIPGGACQPAWSPDGAELVFTSPCSGEQETYPGASLWLMQVDGSEAEALPGSHEGDFDPVWSPDGHILAFTSLRNNNLSQIYLMKISDRSVELFTTASTHEMQPSWSPNGDRLVFAAPSSGGAGIYYRELAGGTTEQFSRESNRVNSHPHWSLDGSYIIYTQMLGSGFPGMISATLEQIGFDAQPLLAVQLQPSRQAVFSPDGNWLALESWPDGANHDIWIMTANASSPQQVTDDPAFDFDAAWRP